MSMDSIYFDTMLILVNNCAWNMVCWCVPKKNQRILMTQNWNQHWNMGLFMKLYIEVVGLFMKLCIEVV
jgi:hypothetical protein